MAIPGPDFLILCEAERKLGKKEALTPSESAVVEKYGIPPKKLCGCGCGKPLEPRVDGERHQIDSKEVNSDCYFSDLGDVLEKYPMAHGIRRRG